MTVSVDGARHLAGDGKISLGCGRIGRAVSRGCCSRLSGDPANVTCRGDGSRLDARRFGVGKRDWMSLCSHTFVAARRGRLTQCTSSRAGTCSSDVHQFRQFIVTRSVSSTILVASANLAGVSKIPCCRLLLDDESL